MSAKNEKLVRDFCAAWSRRDGIRLPVAGVVEIRGRRIAAWRDDFDMQTWTRQTT